MSAWTVTAGKGGGGREKPPPGNHLAVLVGIVDMGTQVHEYQGEVSQKRDIYLLWELVGKKIAGTTRNHVIGAALTRSFNEKATLRKWVEARLGRGIPDGGNYDVLQELGRPCLLNVKNNTAGYPKIEGMAALADGIPAPGPTYPLIALTIEDIRDEGKDIPEWFPWHYGTPLIEHVRASTEIGSAGPSRREKWAGSGQPAEIASNGAPETGERWDSSDGKAGLTTDQMRAHVGGLADRTAVRVKASGAARETAVAGDRFLTRTDSVPW